ncbi:hypothetical protein [Longimicrobium sp.]|uniref:hypothetical protein n=1 Tax=Longimicrobium sp. TaxID=2029185 RepID=UPI002E36A48F|nr:hypothetical protein [Longimicrobium sp.]HEX6038783.1 hypothetical protein [Longimicrobium sp.]
MRFLRTALPLALLALATPITAQEYRAPSTTVVEVLGLRTWTREMMEDSVARFQPGVSLADHACAVILRDSMGFANAASRTLNVGDTSWTVLPVVEPQRRAQVRFAAYTVRRPQQAAWADVFAVLEAHPQSLGGLQYPGVLLGDADSAFGQPLPQGTDAARQAIRGHRTPRDWALARDALLSDSSYTNRTVAALVLSNFAERDSTYYLLADGLRAMDSGASAAELVLRVLRRDAPRPVDWAPASSTLTALFGGTNLFAYTDVMEALVATRVDPVLGRELARVDTILLLDHLGARNPVTPGSVQRYLAYVYGRDLGRDPAAWSALLSAP